MTGPDPSDERTEDEQSQPAQQAGVLGNLPKKRPQVRSPRRQSPPEAKAKEREPAKPAGPAASPSREPKAAREPKIPAPAPDAESTPGAPDLEAIARGGLQIAGEAASLGLRIAGRAAAAIRDSVERR